MGKLRLRHFGGVVSLCVILIVWAAITYSGLIKPLFLPTPSKVYTAFIELLFHESVLRDVGISIFRVVAGFVIAVLANVFPGFDASSMSLHGCIALALGSVLSLALGIGLMALVFYSARRGYDDRVEQDVPEQDKTPGEN